MYILIISRGYPCEKYKMNGIFEFDQAKALVEMGHKVVYASIDMRSIRRKRNLGYECFKKDGVQIEAINIPCGKVTKYILNKMTILATRKLYEKIERKYGKPDIIHSHFINYGFVCTKVFEKNKIPLILTEHLSTMNKEEISPYLMKLGKYTYQRMDEVITVSEYLARSIKEKFDIDAKVIPNVFDENNFKYKKDKKNNLEFNFVSTGSLIFRKRMDLLIEAFNKVFDYSEKVTLTIFGEGPERYKLEQLIKKYSLKEKIFLKGACSRKILGMYYNNSKCFVLASRLETFGVSYIEALATGLPVIATKCGGPEGFVNKNNGVIIQIDDVDELGKALRYMYENISLFNKEEISKKIKKLFSPLKIANELSKVYTKVLSRYSSVK